MALRDVSTLLLTEDDLKEGVVIKKKEDVNLDSFKDRCQPFIRVYEIVVYLSKSNRYVILKDSHGIMKEYI